MNTAPPASLALLLSSALVGAQQPAPDADAFERRMTPEVRVVQRAGPCVVYVETNMTVMRPTFFRWVQGQATSSGSGVVIHEDGYIVTNFHVVRGAERIAVQFDDKYDDKTYPAQLLSWVEEEDLALLKIDGEAPFPTVPLGTSSDLMVGERVLAIGNPYGQTFTVSSGIISGLHRNIQASGLRFENLIQTDASINPGNSGGPLLNVNGELIGINSAVNAAAENIGFAIPVDRVAQVLQDQLLSRAKWRAWLGFDVDPELLEVTRIVDGSPSERAGLQIGDRIVMVGSTPIRTHEDYLYSRLAVQPHQDIGFQVERRGGTLPLSMRGWDRANGILYERAGLTVEPVAYGRARLVRIAGVRPGGPAERLGLQAKDVVDAVRPARGQARVVAEPEQLAMLVVALERGETLDLDVWRDDDQDGNPFERDATYSELYKGQLRLE